MSAISGQGVENVWRQWKETISVGQKRIGVQCVLMCVVIGVQWREVLMFYRGEWGGIIAICGCKLKINSLEMAAKQERATPKSP